MARLLIDGFEDGAIHTSNVWNSGAALTIESSVVKSGAYSAKADITSSTAFNDKGLSAAKSTIYVKAYVRINVASNPSATRTQSVFTVNTNTAVLIARVQLVVATDGTVTLAVFNNVASTTPISGISFSADTWHLVEFKCTINASTGILEVKVDGSTTTASSQNTGSSNVQVVRAGSTLASGTGGSGTIYFDDIVIDDAAHAGASKIICRQGIAGTVTNWDQWTKSTGTDAYSLWSDRPFSNTTYCISPGTGDPLSQAMAVASIGSVISGYGSESIGTSDTINTVQVVANAKRSGGAGRTHQIAYIDSTPAETLYSATLTTSDAYYVSTLFSDTRAHLIGAAIGARKSGGAGGQDMTVNDMWLMVEYTQAAVNATVNATGVGAIVGTAQTTISVVKSVSASGVGEVVAAPTTTLQTSSSISANNPVTIVAAAATTIQASSQITANGVGIVVSTATTSIAIGATVNASGCSIIIAAPVTTLQASSQITASGTQAIVGTAATSPQASSAITATGVGIIVATATTSIELGVSVTASGVAIQIGTAATTLQASSSITANGCGISIATAQTSLQASSSLAVNGCGIVIATATTSPELSTSLSVNGCGMLVGTVATTIQAGGANATVNATGCAMQIGTAQTTISISKSVTVEGCGAVIAISANSIQTSASIVVNGVGVVIGTSAMYIPAKGIKTVNFFETLIGANTFEQKNTVGVFKNTKGANTL